MDVCIGNAKAKTVPNAVTSFSNRRFKQPNRFKPSLKPSTTRHHEPFVNAYAINRCIADKL
jgi:hypothetical protein